MTEPTQKPAGPDRRLDARYRLKRAADVTAVFENGRRAGDHRLTVRALPREDLPVRARLAVAVSKRHGPAVKRNRIKRLCREAFRLTRDELPAGFDYVLLPRAGSEPTLEELMASLRRLAEKATK